jgi:sugar-phosphatase
MLEVVRAPDFRVPARGLLIDCDGVLVDSDASVRRSWARWASGRGLDAERIVEQAHGRRSGDTVAELVDPGERAGALAMIDQLELDDAASVTAVPGAAELLAGLPPERWAVVTSGTTALAGARLAAAGLPRPAVLVSADDVTEGKPAPDGYLAAAARLGLPAARTVVLEDSPAGLAAGRVAGVGTVIGVGERARDADPALADLVVRDLRGLRWAADTLAVPVAALLVRAPGGPVSSPSPPAAPPGPRADR